MALYPDKTLALIYSTLLEVGAPRTMSSDQGRLSVSSVRRFPVEVREELNRFLRRSSWQCLTREFSIDVLTGLKAEALDHVADFVDSDYPEFQEDVRKRVELLKVRQNKVKPKVSKARVKWDFTATSTGISLFSHSFSLSGRSNTALAHGLFCKWPITLTRLAREHGEV